jgi:spore coat polysaccharide biosynthesis predicted glycosyltransferase SpsG
MYKYKNFFFRIDSNKKIGLGHLARCLILAKILRKNCYFVVDSNNNKFFDNLNFKFISLYNGEKFKNEISDAKKVDKIIKKFNNVNLIVDDYRIGAKWHEYFKKKNIKVIVIDDLVNRKFDTDVYLNFKLDNSEEFKKKIERLVNKKSIKLLGPKYSIFDKKLSKKKDGFFNIMINFGNSFDFKDIDKQIIKIHQTLNKKLKKIIFHIAIGNGAKNYKSIIKHSNKYSNFKIIYKKFGISRYLNKINLFIGSASTAIYEMSFLKTPSIFVICNKTQDYKISEIEKLGHYFLININELKNDNFIEFLKNFLQNFKSIENLFIKRKVVIDKMGATRVAKVIKDI